MHSSVYWYTQQKPMSHPALAGEERADVVIVGGGMAGLSAAQQLVKAGKQVVLLEQDYCGAGASGKTSGFITPDSEIELGSLVDNHGPEKAKRIWEFVLTGVERIRSNITKHHFACDYQVQDSLFIANSRQGWRHVEDEYEARKQLGYQSMLYSSSALSPIIASKKYAGAVRYPETFGMNSYLYCQALASLLETQGVRIFEQSKVTTIDERGVATASGRVNAAQVIVCGDRFIPDLGVLKKEIYHVQTFLGISKPLTDAEIRKIFPADRMMVWDTDIVYNYFRVTGDNRLLIGGGDVLYTYASTEATSVEHFARRLARYIQKKFPSLSFELEYVWPGMLGVSKDLLPIIGPDARFPNIFYIGAATGLPWAAALGTYAAERILDGRRDYDEEFSWKRKFVIGPRLQSLITTPATYAVSHGITKYL